MEETLKLAVERVFSQWTALKLAVEQGTAGNFHVSKQLHDDLVLETIDYLNRGADESFIADLLFGRLDEDFMVCVEDESDRVVARVICELHHRITKMGDLNVLAAITLNPAMLSTNACVLEGDFSDDDDEMDTDEAPDLMNTGQAGQHQSDRPQADVDGWFTVAKRR